MFLKPNSWNLPLWSPDDEGAGGTPVTAAAEPAAAAAPAAAEPASVLYPDDPAKPAGEPVTADDPAVARAAELAAMSPEDRAKAEADDATAEAETARLAVVPEDGKYELTMPEGVELDAELMAELGPEFSELGLTTGEAQKLADKFIARETARQAKAQEDWAATISEWLDTAKNDPEMGRAKWDATRDAATGLVDRFGSPALREYLNASGGGNHPEMIRFTAAVGAVIGEDKPAISETPGSKQTVDVAAKLYPNDPPRKGK